MKALTYILSGQPFLGLQFCFSWGNQAVAPILFNIYPRAWHTQGSDASFGALHHLLFFFLSHLVINAQLHSGGGSCFTKIASVDAGFMFSNKISSFRFFS